MATVQATRTPQLKSAPDDTRRITEADADYQRLHATLVRRLTASVRRLVADLRHGTAPQEAANAFARRHTDLLKSAYLAAHREGAKDYYGAVSRTPQKWAAQVQPSERVLVQRILFYAAGSTLKMANEAVQAWHDTQTAAAKLAEPSYYRFGPSIVNKSLAMSAGDNMALAEPATPMQDYFTGLSGRLNLQGEIAWSGLNDGYADAGAVDPASPYAVLFWDLGPVKTQHCDQCPLYAAASPYDRPGTPGGHELDATPGDGHTDCGAACHCSLRYGIAPTAQQAQSVWQEAKAVPPPPPGSLKWPDVPRPTQDEVDAAQQKLLDDYRTQFDRWEGVRGGLPSLPDLFGTTGSEGWVTWDALTPVQQTVLADVFSVLATADATFGHPSLEEAAAAAGLAQEDLDALQAKIQGLADHLDDFLAQLGAASEADLEEWFGKGPIASYFWSLKQDFYDTLEWFLSRTEPPDQTNTQMAERGYTFGYPDQPRNHGRYAPSGWTRGEGGGGGGGVRAPHGMAAAHGQHAHGGQGSAGGETHVQRENAEDIKSAMVHLFGREISDSELAGIAGAQRGDTVNVRAIGRGKGLHVRATGPGDSHTMQHDFIRSSSDGTLLDHLAYVHVAQGGRGEGTRIFVDMVRAQSHLGVDHIGLQAARSEIPGQHMNGYYTWARLGVNGRLTADHLVGAPRRFQKMTTVRELMHAPGGRQWWRQHGNLFYGEFDLHHGSQSWRDLNDYLHEKGMPPL